jgi:hypothetical protein
VTGAEKRAFRRLRGAERARCCAIVRELHRETTYRDLRRIARERARTK